MHEKSVRFCNSTFGFVSHDLPPSLCTDNKQQVGEQALHMAHGANIKPAFIIKRKLKRYP
jgi:hypothetical protein